MILGSPLKQSWWQDTHRLCPWKFEWWVGSGISLFFGASLFNSGAGNGNPLQYSCLGNPMDRGVWWASLWGRKESDTTERLIHLPSSGWYSPVRHLYIWWLFMDNIVTIIVYSHTFNFCIADSFIWLSVWEMHFLEVLCSLSSLFWHFCQFL